jgi:metacaspase-1
MARTRKRLSLHCGSNYPGTPSALQGCVNDAQDLHAWSSAHGWDAGTPLLEPTDAEFIAAVSYHVAQLHYGDQLLLTNSGHGTTLAALTDAEPDGLDEALVFRTSTGRLTAVRDDTLAELFAPVPLGARVIFVSDTCFSGGLQRDVPLDRPAVYDDTDGDRLSSTVGRGAPRYLAPDQLDDLDVETQRQGLAARDLGLAVKPRPSRVALLSGCDADELSYDALWADGRWRGALTATLLDALSRSDDANANAGTSRRPSLRDLHGLVRLSLPSSRYPQSPRLDGSWWQRNRWTL